jgi:hypothetical protein
MNQVNANNSTRRARSANNRSNKRQRARYRYSQEHTGSTGNTYWRTPLGLGSPQRPTPQRPTPNVLHRYWETQENNSVVRDLSFNAGMFHFGLCIAPDSSSAVA